MRGFFITFEGIEGSGKSTVARKIDSLFRDEGIDPLLTREPGGTVISEDIRGILLDPDRTEISARTELLLYLASRVILREERYLIGRYGEEYLHYRDEVPRILPRKINLKFIIISYFN